MDDITPKMLNFVDHLMKNDNIKNEPPLLAETLIINFISKNKDILKKTLTSPPFFPELNSDQTLQLLLTALREKILNEIKSPLFKYIENMDFNVLNCFESGETIARDYLKEKIIGFLDIILTHKEVRYNFNSVINILTYEAIDKYIIEIFKRKEYIYNELIKVQKTDLKVDQYINYLKILLLIKNAAYIKIPFSIGSDTKNLNFTEIQKISNSKIIDKFFTAIREYISKNLPGLNKKILDMALKSNCRQELTQLEEASARLLYALTSRYQEYKHFDKIDRGAETPDKSWFNIAKKNADYHGFSKNLIDELYKIAADNNW